ncbi:MAG: NADH:flavin oxidoreductase/NADH oxidase [Betaproteobacteria bacterium]|nr:NADH:flavin oxidoreductase/NADH oxidase [Betaproteobacteria bacterium]MBI2959119.1 NADH:flavin oxidoreductase/NADH oxidase [Betaproteobacteria bacterium]
MPSALFSPIALRGLELPNRIAVSPMCQYSSENGSATDWHLMHLGSFSLGAAALVMTEMTDVNPIGRISPGCAGLWCDENEAALKRVVDFCRRYGVAKLGLQLAHAGRKGSTQTPAQGGRPLAPNEAGGWKTEAPSTIPYAPGWPVPEEISRRRIKELIADWVAAVKRAERIGYDLVELHGGHGYLVHQFLSPISNQRGDEYGGSLANRMRFPLELFAAMRAAWPADKPMGIRVSATDWVEGGWTPEETVVFARELKALGCDYMDVSSGGLDPRQKIPLSPGYQVPFGEKVRREAVIPTMSVGLIAEAKHAEEIIASGKADMIVIGRAAMWNPRWAWHAAEELGAETAYAPNMIACHPKLRPDVFPRRRQKA